MSEKRRGDAEALGLIPDTTAGAAPRDLEKYIGLEIRKQRHRANLTVQQLAQQAGLSQGMMSKIENGHTSPSLSTLAALAEALSLPLSALFTRGKPRRFLRARGRGARDRSARHPGRSHL